MSNREDHAFALFNETQWKCEYNNKKRNGGGGVCSLVRVEEEERERRKREKKTAWNAAWRRRRLSRRIRICHAILLYLPLPLFFSPICTTLPPWTTSSSPSPLSPPRPSMTFGRRSLPAPTPTTPLPTPPETGMAPTLTPPPLRATRPLPSRISSPRPVPSERRTSEGFCPLPLLPLSPSLSLSLLKAPLPPWSPLETALRPPIRFTKGREGSWRNRLIRPLCRSRGEWSRIENPPLGPGNASRYLLL